MIAAILAALFLSLFGGASYGKQAENAAKDARKKVEQAVSPKDRREQVKSHMDEIVKEVKDYNKKLNSTASDIGKLGKHHDITRKALNDKLDSLARARKDTLNKMLDQRFQMQTLMTREEWEKAFK